MEDPQIQELGTNPWTFYNPPNTCKAVTLSSNCQQLKIRKLVHNSFDGCVLNFFYTWIIQLNIIIRNFIKSCT